MTFGSGDRIRHRRGWYGVVIEDDASTRVRIRFDDGTEPVWVQRDDLRLVDDAADSGLQVLISELRELRSDPRFSADEVRVLDQSIEAIAFGQSSKAVRLRVASEIERMVEKAMTTPFEAEIARQPRVRQWFAAGGRWTLQLIRDRAEQLRHDIAAVHEGAS